MSDSSCQLFGHVIRFHCKIMMIHVKLSLEKTSMYL